MKPDETRDVVEFAIKLEDVLCPIDSHWPIEKYKAIDEAYQAKNKDALALARNDLAAAFRVKAKKVAEKYGYKLVDHKLELYGIKKKNEKL